MTNAPHTPKMPQKMYSGTEVSGQIRTLHMELRQRRETPDDYVPGRSVCGYTLPSWQREIKWGRAQCIRFIESAWLGLHLGTYVFNSYVPPTLSGGENSLCGLLIDGQQRLYALEQYFDGAFPVFGYTFGELDKTEQREFLGRKFVGVELKIWDEDALRELYDRLNFGGTPHEESERATLVPTIPTEV